jgi:rubrerythrin
MNSNRIYRRYKHGSKKGGQHYTMKALERFDYYQCSNCGNIEDNNGGLCPRCKEANMVRTIGGS